MSDFFINSSHSSSFAPPGWLIMLVLGIAIGKSSQSLDSLNTLLSSWQSFVNKLIVPLYAFFVLVYLVQVTARALYDYWSSCVGSLSKLVSSEDASQQPILTNIPQDEDGFVNMSGSYKLTSNDNFEEFLAAQGVPWPLRSAANQARPTHTITHVGKTVTIQIKGIIESQSTFEIDGPPVEDVIRGRVFKTKMRYLESKDGIVGFKTAVSEGYNISVIRQFSSEDRNTITMTSRATFKDGREDIQCVQIFQRLS
eukprot:CAMPEP_0194218942 /NCGR_PEP_ID=MMETSP0156-20130528/24870_1 /TAXON_ID=33649 /ORGANISM="Thalassionema nitzschioides, Strain L26-B" /LENGTH=253 /DNA_ID=CAMNT_0038948457 /DNA_START=13 /DNA_END=774 /DNA_ORIENTATION=-